MLKNLTIKSRLIFVISFLSVLAIIIGFLGLRGMSVANEGLRTVYEDRLVPAGQLGEVNILTAENLRQMHLMLMHDPRLPESKLHDHPLSFHSDKIAENSKRNNKLIEDYAATYLTPEEKVLFDDYQAKRKHYQDVRKKTQDLIEEGKFAEANSSMVKETGPAFVANRDAVQKLLELQINVGKEEYEKALHSYAITRNISISAIVISLLLAAFIGIMLIRAIMRPLAVAQEVAGKIAAGDLTSNIEITNNDELGKLLTSFKAMQNSIQGLISEIKSSTDTINTASKEIASGNNDLSQRTEEQASSLEETASSMEELTSTVKQNTENAKQANQLAISASDVAGKGGEVVSKVVVTMDSINESSRKIVDIISVIDGIAFQTNILALNAAVEAARAGEQGRGFAVVAGEVRNLAQRSAAAAKEIKTLIGDSVEKVEGGSKLVAQAGQTMEEIVTSIRRVTDIMSEITAASVEQSQGIEQVNTAITQMDEVTQQNAALVEEAAAAAESLEEEAQNLSASVATFKVDNNESQGATRAPNAVRQASTSERKALAQPHKTVAVHKLGTERKTGAGKSTAVAKPKPKSGEDGDWQEF
jgi:methyl-accepting chemotaxis protein-1 (serine sensor receptor)